MDGEVKVIDGKGLNMDEIAGGGGDVGWNEAWGPEIVTREIVSRMTTDDVVLDLCAGNGRASHPLAMRGAKVIAVDIRKENLEEGQEIREKAGMSKAEEMIENIKNLNESNLKEKPSIILLSDALIHFTKKEANEFLQSVPTLFNPNKRGLLYVNVPSSNSSILEYPEAYGATKVDEKTVMVMCDCSGELLEEPISFFDEGEVQGILALSGANILGTNNLTRNAGSLLYEVVAEFKAKNNPTTRNETPNQS